MLSHHLFRSLILALSLSQTLAAIGQTQVTVALRDTLTLDKRTSFVSQKIWHTPGRMVYPPGMAPAAGDTGRTFALAPSNFLWEQQVNDTAYHHLLYTSLPNHGKPALFVGSAADTVLVGVADCVLTQGCAVNLVFVPKDVATADTIHIATWIEMGDNGDLFIYPRQWLLGQLALPDTVLQFSIWPYQAGVYISLGTELNTTLASAYRLGEPLVVNDQEIRFQSLDYCQKTAVIQVTNWQEGTILYGYKPGYYLEGWHTAGGYLDSLGIVRGQPLMLYFGGSWCAPCVEEIPRLQRIAAVCARYGIGVASVAVLYQETAAAALLTCKATNSPGCTWWRTSMCTLPDLKMPCKFLLSPPMCSSTPMAKSCFAPTPATTGKPNFIFFLVSLSKASGEWAVFLLGRIPCPV